MKLSEAIRLGSYATERGMGSAAMAGTRRCALGAALFAMGKTCGSDGTGGFEIVRELWPFTATDIPHPITGRIDLLRNQIWRLNDDEGWTREEIADWISTIEPVTSPTEGRDPECSQTTEMERRK